MSVQAMSWVLDKSQSRLAARLVLLSIANHSNQAGEDAWPSVPTIAREAHLSDRQVARAILDLVALRELLVLPRSGPAQANVYIVVMDGDKLSPSMVTNRTVDGDKSGSAIRKNRPEPSKILNPPTPLFQRGVTKRDVRRIAKLQQQFWAQTCDMQGLRKECYRGMSRDDMQAACDAWTSQELLIPIATIQKVRAECEPVEA